MFYRCIIFLILISILFVPSAVFAGPSPELQKGMEHYYKKEWELAKVSFEEALLKDPMDSLTLSYYFASYLWTDSIDIAVKKTEEEYVKNPDDIAVLVKLGFAYYAMGQIDSKMQDESKNEFREILSLEPDNAPAHTGLGLLYDDRRMTPRAKAEFEKAIKLDEEDVIALEHMGLIVMLDDANPEGSIRYFEKILDIVPIYPDANFYMASAYYKLGKYENALPYLNKTLELDFLGIGKGYFSTILMGDIYMKLKKII